MYSFESAGSRKGLHWMVVGALVAAAVMFGFSGVEGIRFPLLFQTAAVVFLVVAVFLITRYSLRLYRYAVEPNGIVDAGGVELCDLVVTEITGKKMRVVARVALREVGEVAVVRRTDKNGRRAVRESLCKEKQVFRYANTPILAEECYISVPEENAVMVIPHDERMTAILGKGR